MGRGRLAEAFGDDPLLAAEIADEIARVDACRLGNVPQARSLDALLGKQRDTRHEGPGFAESTEMIGFPDCIAVLDLGPAPQLRHRFLALCTDKTFHHLPPPSKS